MTELNCIGDLCPLPVIKAKNALESMEKGELLVLVDNEIAAQNLEKLASEKGCEYSVEQDVGASLYRVNIQKNGALESRENAPKAQTIVTITSDKMGEGDEKLGRTLMKGFIYALSESDNPPGTVIFYNKGAIFTSDESECLDDLKALGKKGVQIITCGACVDFYALKLGVGEITNMYDILEKLMAADKVIRP